MLPARRAVSHHCASNNYRGTTRTQKAILADSGLGENQRRRLRRSRSKRARSLLAQKIDIHQHCTACDDDGLATLLKANKACRVRCAVLLALRPPGSSVADVRRANDWVMSAAARPSEIVPFITVLEDDPGASAMVREYASKGAKGVKLIGWAERYIKAHDYDLRSEAMLGVWAAAEELHLPVVAHISIGYDPSRYLAELQDILTKHPKLLLILAHFGLGFDSANLPRLRQLLHDHPNLHIDASLYGGAREKWLHRASNRAEALREVVMAFPNQVLFGTDAFGTKGRAEACSQTLCARRAYCSSAMNTRAQSCSGRPTLTRRAAR